MKSKAAMLVLAAFRLALPGYHYQFPHDYFNHPDYRTEWWYYTGNLHTSDGRRFGFELTFFRQGLNRSQTTNVWDMQDAWLAHLALSDIQGKRFYHDERLNRAGAGIAGASECQARVWNGNWQVHWTPRGEELQAIDPRFELHLIGKPTKPPVIHGENGVDQKSEGAGHASHYFSETRLATHGTIALDGVPFQVEGLAWMDHEFFTNQMASDQAGWDWFSLQLDDDTELMLYRMRRKDGAADPFSSGTYIDARGQATHLTASDFKLTPGARWTKYPIEWAIQAPSLKLELTLTTPMPQQELTGKTAGSPTYWEGAIDVTGQKQGHAIKGQGYLEMTGYAGAINFGG